MEKVISSPSISFAVTVPMAVWFSSALKVGSEVNTGATSLILVTLMIILWVVELVPSLAVTVAV